MDNVDKLKKMIDESKNIVAFTGAGVSTDSGLKDFRSKDGLYQQKYDYPAEYILSATCFYRNPHLFYKYYKENFNSLKYEPNDTHILLKKLEDIGKLKAIITQNIDGLHTKAGSKVIYEVHGTIYKNHCIGCGKFYKPEYIFKSNNIPVCDCGSMIKPNVTLYEESLPDYDYEEGIKAISKADMLLVMGSSLTVFPAASMIDYFNGKYLVIINNDKTSYDKQANLVINGNLAKVSNELLKYLNKN